MGVSAPRRVREPYENLTLAVRSHKQQSLYYFNHKGERCSPREGGGDLPFADREKSVAVSMVSLDGGEPQVAHEYYASGWHSAGRMRNTWHSSRSRECRTGKPLGTRLVWYTLPNPGAGTDATRPAVRPPAGPGRWPRLADEVGTLPDGDALPHLPRTPYLRQVLAAFASTLGRVRWCVPPTTRPPTPATTPSAASESSSPPTAPAVGGGHVAAAGRPDLRRANRTRHRRLARVCGH